MPEARCVPSAARWGCSCAGRAAHGPVLLLCHRLRVWEEFRREAADTSKCYIASVLESELGLLAQEICPSLKCTEVAAPGVGRAVVLTEGCCATQMLQVLLQPLPGPASRCVKFILSLVFNCCSKSEPQLEQIAPVSANSPSQKSCVGRPMARLSPARNPGVALALPQHQPLAGV